MKEEDTIICRCEDITLQEIHQLLASGCESIHDLKRVTRCGMGPCQGRTCIPLLHTIMAEYKKVEASQVELPTKRPPTKPIQLGMIADAFLPSLFPEGGGGRES